MIKIISCDFFLFSVDYVKIFGGIFYDFCVYDIDLICWIIGEVFYIVFCFVNVFYLEIGEFNDVDMVGVVMKFLSGVIG